MDLRILNVLLTCWSIMLKALNDNNTKGQLLNDKQNIQGR